MTKKFNKAPMALDLDSFLQLQTSGDEDDDDLNNNFIPHRTVDEILLNDSDSDDTDSSKMFKLSDNLIHSNNFHSKQSYEEFPASSSVSSNFETLISNSRISNKFDEISVIRSSLGNSGGSLKLDEKNTVSNSFISRRNSGNSLLLGRNLSRPLPPLFGSVKPNPKPGAALAAATAASRLIPTPHAAAIKSRREKSLGAEEYNGVYFEGLTSSEAVTNGSGSGTIQIDIELGEDGIVGHLSSSTLVESVVEAHFIENASGGEVSPEKSPVKKAIEGQSTISEVGKIGLALKDLNSCGTTEYVEARVDSSCVAESSSNSNDNSLVLDSVHVVEEDVSSFVEREEVHNMGEEVKSQALKNTESKDYTGHSAEDGEENLAIDETNTKNGVSELIMDSLVGSECKSSNWTENTSRSPLKPLELAEEIEKKHAFSGLDWEEGVAAQPMRLEGIRRGPPAVGYLQIDLDDMITQKVSSQAFRSDHGSPHFVAVHANFIAVGMSKGLILVAPSNYSPYHTDHMDPKMLYLGYGDGHIISWDVQKAQVVKLISGEHTSPVAHTLFLGQDSQATRNFKVVTGDCKGRVLLHVISVVPMFSGLPLKQRTGTVLSASPLLVDISGGALSSAFKNSTASSSGIGSMMGGVVGSKAGWKLFSDSEASSLPEQGKAHFQLGSLCSTPKARWSPRRFHALHCMEMYVADRRFIYSNTSSDPSDKASLLAIAWDRKVQVAKLVKKELKVYREWTLDNSAIGVAWLDDQILVVLTLRGHLCLFAKEGTELHRSSFSVDGSVVDNLITYQTYLNNIFGNPEKTYHNCVAARGATIYVIGSMQLIISRLLPWKEHIQVLQMAGDWMGALEMAMRLYDGQAHGVIDLPRTVDAIREAESFSYISVAFNNQVGKAEQVDDAKSSSSSVQSEMEEQFARVGGVAVEFCVHIKRVDILFDKIFSKFVAVQHGGTFLELLEPYILKDMLGCLPPEIMQELVEHYSSKGWLQRVEQCVLHMDISSLDFNQVVRLCREHGLHGALIYLFNRGLDDYKAPLEELLLVVQSSKRENALAIGYRMLVYLKYCFTGLAFPPGHGTISSTRLPSVRTELVFFLLEDSKLWFQSLQQAANLLVELAQTCTISCDMEDNEENSEKSNEDQSLMVQHTINSLANILDVKISEVIVLWPSKEDTGHLLEFISYFITWERATVSKAVLSRVLEYLISETNLSPRNVKTENSKSREKHVLAVLRAVSETDWDSSYVLYLSEMAQFYQVCGFVYASRGQHIAALDAYMKDMEEPLHAFSFINMLLERDNESATLRSAVLSRISELVILSREGAFFLVVDHFSRESERILSELRPHSESLFLYLKTTIEAHLSGKLDFSFLEKSYILDVPCGRIGKEQMAEAYLKKISDLPKLLQHNPVNITDDVVELYLELLCKYERKSVLKFLETFESYRLEQYLRLCLEYGVIDAAAFLLERVGNVGSALLLTLSGLKDKFENLEIAVGSIYSDRSSSLPEREHLNFVMRMEEDKEALVEKWRIVKSHRGAHILKNVFAQFIREVVDGMIGYVHLPQEFGNYKLTISGLLGTYGFERRILDIFQIENVPQLRLAPPMVYHEKVKKGMAASLGESSAPAKAEKTNKNRKSRDLKMKGSSSATQISFKI
ncbi:hypothetical protein MKX01_031058 [Papaver californicum]|nr:hypothetical protein MKX01_031058 [Papaver californicum]